MVDQTVVCVQRRPDPLFAKSDTSEDFRRPGPRLDTTVTWTLTPTASGGTLLNLVHHGFQPDDYAFQVMGQGWRSMVTAEKITRILAGDQVFVV
jgi:uncharacterized protein YndB with AHSA1/START domain